jgi:hypothetical protein
LAIAFVGEEEQLVLAMAQSDLALALYPGIGWELRLGGGAAPAGPIPVAAPPPAPAVDAINAPNIPAAE